MTNGYVWIERDVFIRFFKDSIGFKRGDVVRVTLQYRSAPGFPQSCRVWVKQTPTYPEGVTAWSDYQNFEEISEMEILALAASGEIDLD